jgi:methylenetetrahydrofolate dehydrogenase (NADP+)/methenyltetrahydrofolate cyclohydrolase
MIKTGSVVIDAGVATDKGKNVGDLDKDIYLRDDLIVTPTRGGIGPLTVCSLFANVIQSAQKTAKKKLTVDKL